MNAPAGDDTRPDRGAASRAALLVTVLNRIPAMVGYWDRDLRNRMANDAYVEFFGFTPGSMWGVHISEVLGDEIFRMNLPYMERVLAGETQLFDRTIVDPDGRPRHTQASYIPDYGDDGEVAGFVVLVTEVTERKLAEEAVRRSEENLAVTLRSIGEAVIASDASGTVTRMNPAAEALTGWPAHEAMGRPFEDVVRLRRDESVLVARDGHEMHVEYTGSPINDPNGNVVGQVEVIRDVSEAHRMRDEMAALVKTLDRTGHIARVGGWEWDLHTQRRIWLPEIFRILELDQTPVPPDFLSMCADADSASALREAIAAGIAVGTPWDMELPMLTATARRIWVRAQGEAVVEDGVIGRLIGTLQDITERKQLEAQLLRATRLEAVGRLAGGVAHDFNNMLGVILGRTELALHEQNHDALRADLEEIRAAAQRSADLTRQLLTFARQQAVEPAVLDVNQVVSDLFILLRRIVGVDITIDLQLAEPAWNVEIDRSQIDQILTNLCMNARDAIGSRPQGVVEISVAAVVVDEAMAATSADATPGEFVRISVRDNGDGIEEDVLGKIFDPFFTTKEFGANSGLGLATVLGAVTQNGGFVLAETELGVGTRFDVFLPRHLGDASVPTEADAEPSSPGRETILVVEDEPALLALVVRVLEGQGYDVLSTTSPSEALHLANEHPGGFRLLLTDVVMRDMNGRDLADAVLGAHPHTAVVFMSGYAADIIPARVDEDLHFLQKPFSVAALNAAVRAALDQIVR